jgi:serine/threonine-protein kinase
MTPVEESRTPFGHYELVKLLGAGGMGDVYLGIDTRLQRQAAIKFIQSGHDAAHVEARFLREARAIAALDHPNICTLYEFGRVDGRDFLAMQYVEGETLADRYRRGPLPLDAALRIAADLASALAYAHSRSVLHRDLKPQNVMLQADGRVVLLDFGLAKISASREQDPAAAETEAALTRGAIIGTTQYMSPEQLSGQPADARSDIFSFGVVLYELLTGRHPFRRDTQALTISAILTAPVPPMAGIAADERALLDLIVGKALARNPEERYTSAADLLVDLRRAIRGNEASTVTRRRWPFAVAAAAVMLAGAVALWSAYKVGAEPAAPSTAAVAAEHSLTYWLDIRDGTAAVSRVSADAFLPAGARIRIGVSGSNPGYLYLVNEDNDATASLALVFPVGSGRIEPSLSVTTDWYAFETAGREERIWLVWSETVVPQLEALRPLVNERDLGRVTDASQAVRVREWLAAASVRMPGGTPNAGAAETTVPYTGSLLVRQMQLRHGKVTS